MPPSSGFRLCLPGCGCEIHCQEASPDPEDGVEDEEVGPDDRPLRRPAHVADDAVSVICSVAEGRRLDGTGQEDDPVQGVPIPVVIGYFAEALLAEFDRHSVRLRTDARARREAVLLRNVVADREMQESVSVEDSLGKRQPGDEYQGDINLRTLRTLLSIIDGRGFERSAHQMRFHSAFERATARVAYRKDWESQRPAIMRKNEWPSCPGEVLISTPRRFGKTFSIAIYAACMALAYRLEIVIFSPARRASRKLLERVVEFVRLLGCEDRIMEYNQEQCRVQSYDGATSLIRSFPSKVGSLKGVSGDVIVLEEAAYCDPGLISEVIVPLLSMQNSVLLCISTLLESGNHYSKMFELKDSVGRQLFETISITLVCEDCLKTESPEKCTHKLHEMPRWLSSAKMEVVRSLLSEDPAMLLRESMGVGADGSQKAFPSVDIEAFMKRNKTVIDRDLSDAALNLRSNVNHIIVAVDPSGGGSSAFAVCSIVQLSNGGIVVTGAEALRTKDVRTTHRCVLAHIAKVRQIPGLESSTVVLQLESNLAFECQHIMHTLNEQKVKKWVALSEGSGGTVGWLTTNERKEAMCFQLRDALRVGCISLHRDFFTTTASRIEILKTIDEELRNFAIVTEPAKTTFGKVRKTYTGKIGGRNDDVVIALQLAITGCRCFYASDKYSQFRPEY